MTDEERLQQLQDKKRLAELQAKKNASEDEGVNYSKLFLGVDDIEDFDAGDALKNIGSNFYDQMDAGARFINKGFTLGQADKLYSGVNALLPKALGGSTYDESLTRNKSRNEYLKEKHPTITSASELGGSLLGITKLVNAGVTTGNLVKQVAKHAPDVLKNSPRLAKALGYVGNVTTGATDAALISGVMAEGDGREFVNAAETGAMWGAGFAALPTPLKAAFNLFAEKRIGKSLMDKAGNWTPIHLMKGEHETLKGFYKTVIGGIAGGGKLRGQEKAYFDRMLKKEAEIAAQNKTYSVERKKRMDMSSRKQIAKEEIAKNVSVDTANKNIQQKIMQTEAETATNITQQKAKNITIGENLHLKTLNDAAPKGVNITRAGHDGIDDLYTAYKKAYTNAWAPVGGLSDDALNGLISQATRLKKGMSDPTQIAAMTNNIAHLKNLKAAGGNTRGAKTLDDKLRKASYAAGQKGDSELREALLALRDGVLKSVPKNAQKAINEVNSTYPRYLVNKDAANKSITTDGVPTAQALVQSVQKISRGEAALNKGVLQPQAVAGYKAEKAGGKILSDIETEGVEKIALINSKAKEAELASARANRQTRIEAKNARTDRRTLYDANTKARNEAKIAPIKTEILDAKKYAVGSDPKIISGYGGASIAGSVALAPLNLMGVSPMTTLAASVPVGMSISRLASTPTAQKIIAGQTSAQASAREMQKNTAEALRKVKGTAPTIAGYMGSNAPDEEENQPRIRRRN